MRPVALCIFVIIGLWSAPLRGDDHVILVDDELDFSTLRTFTIQDVNVTSTHPALDSPVLRRQLRDVMQTALVARGVTTTSNQPSLIVHCRVRGVDFGVDRTGRPVEQGRGAGRRQPNPNRSEFIEGILVIDVLRADTRELVWRGVYHDTDRDPSRVAATLPKHATELLSQFPGQRKP